MRTFPEAGAYGSAADLYAGILAAALQSPDDDGPCFLPDAVEVPADHPHSLCTLQTVTTWNGGRRAWDTAFAEDLAGASKCMAEVHGPQRQGGALKVRFSYRSQGARCSLTVRGTRPRLLELADTVRKQWALFGGGPKPAELVKPRAPRRASWPMSIVRVWLAQLQDKDHAGAVITGETIGARFYPAGNGTGAYILAAPLPVDGLPDGMVSTVRNDGRWTVSDLASGLKLGNGAGSRKAAETEALRIWSDASEEKRAGALRQARMQSADHAAARAAWCKVHGIADELAPADAAAVPDVPADVAPVPDLEPVPECQATAAAAPADDVARAEAVAEFEAAAVDAHPLAVSADRIDRMRARAADRPDLAGFFAHAIGLHEASHARLAAAFAAFDAVGDGCELATVDGARFCVLLPDASQPGRYRWQGFDARGFFTHSTHATPADAVADAARAGFVVPAPGILDRLAAAPEWARGMAAADVMQRHNAGMLSWPDACAELERINAPAAEPVPAEPARAAAPVPANGLPSMHVLQQSGRIANRCAALLAGFPPARRAQALRREADRIAGQADRLTAAGDVPATYRGAAGMLRALADTLAPAAEAAGPGPAAAPAAPKRVRAPLASHGRMPRPLPRRVMEMPGGARAAAAGHRAQRGQAAPFGWLAGALQHPGAWCRAGPGQPAAGGRAAAARAPPLPLPNVTSCSTPPPV